MNNANNFFNSTSQKKMPLYPEEAYSLQNNQNMSSQQENPNQTSNQNPMSNPLMPLLLSALQGGGDNQDMMKMLLSGMAGGSNQAAMIQALTSSLNKNKKKESPAKTEPSTEKAFPKNEYLY